MGAGNKLFQTTGNPTVYRRWQMPFLTNYEKNGLLGPGVLTDTFGGKWNFRSWGAKDNATGEYYLKELSFKRADGNEYRIVARTRYTIPPTSWYNRNLDAVNGFRGVSPQKKNKALNGLSPAARLKTFAAFKMNDGAASATPGVPIFHTIFVKWEPKNPRFPTRWFIPGEVCLPMYIYRNPEGATSCQTLALNHQAVGFTQTSSTDGHDWPMLQMWGPAGWELGPQNSGSPDYIGEVPSVYDVVSWDEEELISSYAEGYATPGSEHVPLKLRKEPIGTPNPPMNIIDAKVVSLDDTDPFAREKYVVMKVPDTEVNNIGPTDIFQFERGSSSPKGRFNLVALPEEVKLEHLDDIAFVGWFLLQPVHEENTMWDRKKGENVHDPATSWPAVNEFYIEELMMSGKYSVGGPCPATLKIFNKIYPEFQPDNQNLEFQLQTSMSGISSADVECEDCGLDVCEGLPCKFNCEFYVSEDNGTTWGDMVKSKTICMDDPCPCKLFMAWKEGFTLCKSTIHINFELNATDGTIRTISETMTDEDVDDVNSITNVRVKVKRQKG